MPIAFFRSLAFRRLLGGLVSAGLMVALAWLVDWPQLRAAAREVSPLALLPGILLAGVAYPLHAARLHLLLVTQDLRPGFAWAHAVTWIGQFYNALLPTGVGGEIARLYHLLRYAPQRRADALACLFLDRLWGLGSLLVLSTVALLGYAFAVREATAVRPWIWPVALASVGLLVAALITIGLPLRRWPRLLRAAVVRLGGPARFLALVRTRRRAAGSPVVHAHVLAVSLAIWLAEFVAAALLAAACGLDATFAEITLAVAVANLATIPFLGLGGHGIREGALLGALLVLQGPAAAATAERGVVFAFAFLATTLLWSFCGGLVQAAAIAGWCPPRAATPVKTLALPPVG